MTTAIYPGSFDPITHGHLDIIKRASAMFEEVIVGVYDRPEKQLLFTTEERVQMARQAVAHLGNVQAQSYSGLTVDFAKQVGAKVMVRGLRMSSDFEREFEMAMMNKKLAPDIELVCLMASLEFQFLSSSLLKEVAQLGGCLQNMVPDHVADALRKKFASQLCHPTPKVSTP
ncbi:MAG TPA: pantetheine-phosphate adenylyltransferase [Dehalococcoidia bacterium]|nr:pantetheine-phosphate adenylyltransferase [Dehalococcoidia bacterium]